MSLRKHKACKVIAGLGLRSYSTTFPLTENPINDGGVWTGGAAQGIDWKDVRSVSTLLCGTNNNPNPSGGPYDDSTGLVIAPWHANQEVIATVFTQNQQTASGHNQEVEIRLRSTISANINTGYELAWRCTHTGEQYAAIAIWNGAIGDFAVLTNAASPPGLQTGYQVRGTMIGTMIRMYQRVSAGVGWTEIANYDTVNDTTKFSTGLPGIGFWNRQTGSNANTDFGFTSLQINDL